MKVLYFAWVRQRVGVASETVEVPEHVASVRDLIGWLRSRGEGYEHAFANLDVIRAAVDKTHADLDQPISSAGEVAFFPPVTGG